MGWRTVVITERCKLDLSMGYMVVRGEETVRILIDEMAMLMIENPAVSMTGCLLSELADKKVRVIFCDSKRSPYAELQPYNGSYDCSKKIRQQTEWTEEQKQLVWTAIVSEKICNQAKVLIEYGHEKEAAMLTGYMSEMCPGDSSNREGHAAKVYFNALFGKSFSRGQENTTNTALNYGYGLLLSAFNREVTMNGFLTHIGLCHNNMFNPYNLSCDLMEPFRALVDRCVIDMKPTEFGKSEKQALLAVLHSHVYIAGTEQTVLNAVKIYARSVFESVGGGSPEKINFIEI